MARPMTRRPREIAQGLLVRPCDLETPAEFAYYLVMPPDRAKEPAFAAFRDFPWQFNTVIALTIAVIKATLVVLYFMHVRYSSRLIWVIVTSALFWLAIMFALTISDYWTRTWLPPL